MKRKIIDSKDLKLISGGEILRNRKNGTYFLRGTSDTGNDIAIKYGKGELMAAVEYEWILCEEAIRKAEIADTLEGLMRYYENKFYYEDLDDFYSEAVNFSRRKSV